MWTSRGTGDSDRLRVAILRDLPPLSGEFYFQPPCFPGFLMAHLAIPDTRLHGSITPGSLQVFCAASAAVMFDAAQKKHPSLNSLPSATAYFDLVIISRNQSHNCLRRCSSNQTLCSHPELQTHLFLLTARLCLGAGPGKFSALCYRRSISAIGKDPDRNTRSDAKR